MVLRFLLFFVFWTGCAFADLRIESPKHHQVTNQRAIDFVFSSSVDQGFIMLNDRMIPIRRHTRVDDVALRLGINHWRIHVFNDDLQLQPNLSREITIYRYLSTRDDIQDEEAQVLTDLAVHHYIPVLDDGFAKMDQPILKKDAYAFLMWFYSDQSRQPVLRQYQDMSAYSNYLNLFQLKPQLLPLPRLDSFYPNAYVTREAFVNLLLLLNGSSDQVSTSMLVHDQLQVPQSLRHIIPKTWKKPLVFVTRREALAMYFSLFKPNALPQPTIVTIDWGNSKPFPTQVTRYVEVGRQLKVGVQERLAKIQWKTARDFDKQSHRRQTKAKGRPVLSVSKRSSASPTMAVVLPGDSIQKIARRYYGDASKWKALVQVNQLQIRSITVNGQVVSSVHIEPGQSLRLL